jgi:hypothetical protein
MKRGLLVLFAFVLVLGTYAASPYLGLRRIISAVHARNAAALSDSVDFDRLRRSLTGQIVDRYLQLTGRTAQLGAIGNMFAVAIGTSIADPFVAQILNPEGLIALLEKGDVISGSQQVTSQFGPFSNASIGSVWEAISNSDYGVARFFISLPTSVPSREQFRLELQLLQWQWKLTSIDLPQELRTRLATELAKQIP